MDEIRASIEEAISLVKEGLSENARHNITALERGRLLPVLKSIQDSTTYIGKDRGLIHSRSPSAAGNNWLRKEY